MTEDARLREQICMLARSMFERGLTHGSTGDMSARLSDGGLLVSPTGTSFGGLDPSRLSRFDAQGRHIEGDEPTKEMPLHSAFYDTRSQTGAVVHLHCCHAVAWSMMPDADEDDFLPPLTPYAVMHLGRVKLLPFFRPGDPAMGTAVRGLAARDRRSCSPITARSWRARMSRPLATPSRNFEATARLAVLMPGPSAPLADRAADPGCRHDVQRGVGGMKFSANLGFLWNDRPLPAAIRAAKAAGFDAVECHWPYDVSAASVKAALDETGLGMLGLNTRRGDTWIGENGLSALSGQEVACTRGDRRGPCLRFGSLRKRCPRHGGQLGRAACAEGVLRRSCLRLRKGG